MATWFTAVQQSFNKNRILDHCSIISVATLVNSLPSIFPIRFQYFNDFGLVFYLDNRTNLFNSLLSQPSEFLWHFPLTNEFYKFSGVVSQVMCEEVLSENWSRLTQREKEGYCGLPPDILVDKSLANNDIDHFKPQEPNQPSRNFGIICIRPESIEHSVFLDKSAIGNTRKTYESLPQPDAVSKKWVHRLTEGEWVIVEMNVPAARA